jgi:hypothetical protein
MSSGFGEQSGEGQPGQGQPGQGQPGHDQFGQGQFGQGQFAQQPGWQSPPPQYGQPGPYGQAGPYVQPGPYAQPGPYVQVGAGWPQAAGRRTNSLAIAALCCAIGQVIAGPFAGIAAIVLGAISLKQIRLSGEDGHGMAVAGLLLGIVGTVLVMLFLIFAVALFHGMGGNLSNVENLNN